MQPKRRARAPTGALVFAHAEDQRELSELAAAIDALQGDIAEQDLRIETFRSELAAFAEAHRRALAREHSLLERIEGCLGHLRRLEGCVLSWGAAGGLGEAKRRVLEQRREREIAAWHQRRLAASTFTERDGSTPQSDGERAAQAGPTCEQAALGKAHFRSLARRFHPDLARDETERARHSELMAHINALYRAGDWPRLMAMAEAPAPSMGIDAATTSEEHAADGAATWRERIRVARHAQRWHQELLASLLAEYESLRKTPLATLAAAVADQARWRRGDPHATLRAAARSRARMLLAQIPVAVKQLEQMVRRAKNQPTSGGRDSASRAKTPAVLARLANGKRAQALAPLFDPVVGQSFAELGLEALAQTRLPPRIGEQSEALAELACDQPALMRLVLLAYIAQLGHQPLEAIASYEALAVRFAALGRDDVRPVPLGEALVQGDGLVRYRLLGDAGSDPQVRLCLRAPQMAAAVPSLLHQARVRRLFAEVLSCLGEAGPCGACHADHFSLPLFWLRGLDDLRALVCPACGAAHKRYVLARGDDVQAVLNRAYLQIELLTEASVQVGRHTVGLQLPSTLADVTPIRSLAMRLSRDLFVRNGLEVAAGDFALWHEGKPLKQSTLLGELLAPRLTLRMRGKWAGGELRLADEIRFRVRTRFAPAKD